METNQKYMSILKCEHIQNSNANLDEHSFSGRKFECAGLLLKELAKEELLDKNVRQALESNYLYIHDLDSYALGNHNCLQIDFKKLLTEGFTTRNGDVRPPKSISTAMQQVAVIMQCQSQVQFGGVASLHIDFDLAPFVKMSFYKHFRDGVKYLCKRELDDSFVNTLSINSERYKEYSNEVYNYAYEMTNKEGMQAAQGLYHNLNTLESRAGSQLPFSSLNFGRDTSIEGRLVSQWLLQASIDGIGKFHRTPIFPITIFQLKRGVNMEEGDPNYDLKLLALKSTSKRLYPNYVNCDWENAREDAGNPDTYMSSMGCRTFIGTDRNGLGNIKVGRGNASPVTIILPKIGIEYGICQGKRENADIQGFFNKLERILKLAEKSLLDRYQYISSQSPRSAPFMYINGTIQDANKCVENVNESMKHTTQAIGVVGLAETLQALIGENQTTEKGRTLGEQIIKRIFDFTKEAAERNNLNFSCYFTPSESLSYTAMQRLQKEFGKIPNITENEFLTNSIHVPVWEKVDIFNKIDIESNFTKYGTGGCITYVEFDSKIKNNLQALEKVIDYAMNKGIPYMAINFPIDTCLDCGLNEDIGNICPRCKSNNIEHLARVTGYLSTDVSHFNRGKQEEVKKRFKHSLITNI